MSALDEKQVGKYYRVPCLWSKRWHEWVPINGPLHDDKEHIKFPYQHWHIDWRFVSKSRFSREARISTNGSLSAGAVDIGSRVHGRVFIVHETAITLPTMRRMRLKRDMPPYVAGEHVPWLPSLERKFTLARLPDCNTCPHRGISVASMPADRDGNVVCPGHGLKWNLRTRQLVPQSVRGTIAFMQAHENESVDNVV